MTEKDPGSSPDYPVYFKWVRDENGDVSWGKILLMFGLTVVSGYLAAKSQRVGSSAVDPVTTLRLKLAQRKIKAGVDMQRRGHALEESGWSTYDSIRPAG